MPPEGRGDPLTKEQVGLLRAWIDQGAAWENAVPTNLLDVTLAPTFGWTAVSGDNGKFREQYWQRDGPNGGLDRFQLLEQPNPDTRITASGHALLDDYKIVLNADRNELGFIHSGWEQFRQYCDDTGGYLPSHNAPPPQRLGTELYLDTGKAWIDFGLTLPQWPKLVLGYEYDYKRGQEAITSWGAQASPTGPHNLAPASKSLDEGTHVINLDMAGNLKGIDIEDRFRGEFYSLNTHYTNLAARGPVSQNASESDHYFQGANSIGLERRFKEWLFGSAGYLYSKLNADDSFSDASGLQQRPLCRLRPAHPPGKRIPHHQPHNLTWTLPRTDSLCGRPSAMDSPTRAGRRQPQWHPVHPPATWLPHHQSSQPGLGLPAANHVRNGRSPLQ